MMQRDTNNYLPAPITSGILRRVLCELPIGTSRAVESCVNSYKKRFMSSQDILEFLRSIAVQSETLKSVFREHDRAGGKFDVEPPEWEQEETASSPVGTLTSSVREPAGPPTGHMVEPPAALLHGPIPSVTDHSAWSVPDGGSGVPLELLFEQEKEYATWSGQPRANFSSATIAHNRAAAAAAALQTRQEWPEHSPRSTLQRSSSPVLQRSSSPVLQRSGSPVLHRSGSPVLQRSGSPLLQRSSSPKRTAERSMMEPGGAVQESMTMRAPPAKEPLAQSKPKELSLPLDLQWEQEHWSCKNPVPSPEDLVSGASTSSTPSGRSQVRRSDSMTSSSGEPGGASTHHEEPLGVPFELLWEQEQFQRVSFEYQQSHHNAEQHDLHHHHDHHHHDHHHHDHHHHDHHHHEEHHDLHTHHASHHDHHAEHHDHHAEHHAHHHHDHHDHQEHHHEPGGMMREEEQECRHVAPTGVPLDLLYQQGPEYGVPHPEDLVSAQAKQQQQQQPQPQQPPVHLPLELLWQTNEWRQSDYQPIDPAQPASMSKPKVASPTPTLSRNISPPRSRASPPAPQGLPLELMFQQGPQPPMAAPAATFAGISPNPKTSARQNKVIKEDSTASLASWISAKTAEDEDELEEVEEEEEEVAGEVEGEEEEAKPSKPKRRRIRTVKPSAPPTEEEKEQMARYTNRRREEIERRRKEAARAAVRMPPVAMPVRKGKKKGAEAVVKWEPPPAGSEDKPAGILRYTLLELAKHVDREGKVALKHMIAAYTDGRKTHEELAADVQTLVDAHQITIPLPLPMRGGPFRMPLAPHMHCPTKFGHPHHPAMAMHGRPGMMYPPPFPGMPGFHPGMMGPMGMHFPPGMDMSMMMPKQGKPAGGGRRRKRKRGADRDANARCPVCVDGPLQDERWVKCDGCSTWYHQVCVLYNELANGRKLRFFCRTPNCQKRNSRQLNRRYRKARHPMSPMLAETALSVDMALRAASVARTDRKVVVKEVFAMPLEECMLGDASPKDAEGKCECCTRRTIAAFQHTVTGSDLLFMVLFVDEHLPKNGVAGRAIVQELAANGLYEEASEGECLRVEAAMVEGYLRDLAERGVERVEVAERGEGGDKSLISSSDPAECARRARLAWLRGAQAAQSDGAVAEVSEALVRLNAVERKVGEEGPATAPAKVDCKMMETASKLRSFLASRQYAFASLQQAKYGSMMLVYHLDQAMSATALTAADAVNQLGEEEGEEEEVEDMGEEAQNADEDEEEMEVEGGAHHHHHHDHGFDGGFHHGVDAWRKEVGSGSFNQNRRDSLYSQPFIFPFLEAEN